MRKYRRKTAATNKNKGKSKWIASIAAALLVVSVLVVSGRMFNARAVDTGNAQHTHQLSYSQRELVNLLHASIRQELAPDMTLLQSYPGNFAFAPEQEVVQPEDVLAGTAQANWVMAQLEGKTLLQTVVEPDGCIAFVALTDEPQLVVITVNPTQEVHAFALQVEQLNGEMSAAVSSYQTTPVITELPVESEEALNSEEAAEEVVTEQDNNQAQLPQQEETATGSVMNLSLKGTIVQFMPLAAQAEAPEEPQVEEPQEPVAEEPVEQPAAEQPAEEPIEQPTQEEQPTEEPAEEPVEEPVEKPAEEPVDLDLPAEGEDDGQDVVEEQPQTPEEPVLQNTVTDFTIEETETTAFDKTADGVAVVVQPNGLGVITLNTGLLRGGPLDATAAAPRARGLMRAAALPTIELLTGSTSATAGEGFLRVYSQADPTPSTANGGAGQIMDNDYATYSLDGHKVVYDMDQNTNIIVYSAGTTTATRNFTVELANSQPVTIKSFQMQGRSTGGTSASFSAASVQLFQVASGKEGAVLNINNTDGDAIVYSGQLQFKGNATVNANGNASGWGINRGTNVEGLSAVEFAGLMSLDGGFTVNVGGGSGVKAYAGLSVLNASTLNATNVTGLAAENAVHVQGVLTVTQSSVQLNNVTTPSNGLYVSGTSGITNNSTLQLNNVTSATSGARLMGAVTLTGTSAINLQNVTATNGAYLNSTLTINTGGALYQKEVTTTGDGFFVSGTTTFGTAAVPGASVTAQAPMNVDGRAYYFTTVGGTFRNSNFNLDIGDSKGGALYMGGSATITNSNFNITANASELPVMEINAGYSYFYNSDVTVNAGSSKARSVYFHDGASATGYTIRLGYTGTYEASNITVTRQESDQDAVALIGTVYMYKTSKIDVRSTAQHGRSLYIASYLYMYNDASIYAEGSAYDAVNTGEDDGSEDPGETDPGETDPGETDPDDTEVVVNEELNEYKNEIAAVVYVASTTRLYNNSNIEAKGNAATTNDPAKIAPQAFVCNASYTRLFDNSWIRAYDAKIGARFNTLNIRGTNGAPTRNKWDTEATIENPLKSWVKATGTEIGVVIVDTFEMSYSYAGNLYGKGGGAGIIMRRTAGGSSNQTTYRNGNTVIAIGTQDTSKGLIVTQDVRFDGQQRVIATGGAYGVQLVKRASNLSIRYGAQLIAIGRVAGNVDEEGSPTGAGIEYTGDGSGGRRGSIYAYYGGKIYARGPAYGIYAYNSHIRSRSYSEAVTGTYAYRNDTRIVGIGGIADENMTSTIDVLNLPDDFSYDDMPMPTLTLGNNGSRLWNMSDIQVPGLTYGAPGTSGIVTGGGSGCQIFAYYGKSQIEGYGGEWGIANSSQALDSDEVESDSGGQIRAERGGRIEGHGGKVGIQSTTYLNSIGYGSATSTYRDSMILGYGEDYGLHIGTYLTSRGASGTGRKGIIYGAGIINGISAGNKENYTLAAFRSNSSGYVVAETWIEPDIDPGSSGDDHPMLQPALKAPGRPRYNGGIEIRGTNSLIHEIYNPINMVFTTPPPYQFNTEFYAIGQNMGVEPEALLQYRWTSTNSDPTEENLWNSWDNLGTGQFPRGDDLKLISAGTGIDLDGNPRMGLIAHGYSDSVNIVANCDDVPRMRDADWYGKVYSNTRRDGSMYRYTFRNVKIRDLRTMEVELDLRDWLSGANLNLTDIDGINPETEFELIFRPQDPEGLIDEKAYLAWLKEEDHFNDKEAIAEYIKNLDPKQELNLTTDLAEFDSDTGVLSLHKLRLGSYILRPKAGAQLGWPFKDLPEIEFRIACDTSNADDQSTWLEALWIDKPAGTPATGNAKVTVPREVLDTTSYLAAAAIDPTIAPPDGPWDENGFLREVTFKELYDVNANYKGKAEIYYERIPVVLDLKLLDYETWEPLRGGFTVTAGLDGVALPTAQFPVITSTSSTAGVYPSVNAFAGLDYTIAQVQTGTYPPVADYTRAPGSYTIKLDADLAMVTDETSGERSQQVTKKVTVKQDNEKYLSFAQPQQPVNPPNYTGDYAVYAFNEKVFSTVPLKLVDHDQYTGVPSVEELLIGGEFVLQVQPTAGAAWIETQGIIDNGDGTYGIKVSNGRAGYRLVQKVAPTGYALRNGYYSFTASNVTTAGQYRITYSGDNNASVPVTEGSNGWITPRTATTNNGPVVISNYYAIGDLTVTVNATGLWAGHADAQFIVEIRGKGLDNTGKVHYQTISLQGSNNFDTYKTDIDSGTAVFKDVITGPYDVIVYPAMRTGAQPNQEASAVRGTPTPAVFNFANSNEQYFSGGSAVSNQFTINFGG
ncbi:hypothetical protein LJC61_03825 [Ruminococcaceae bacterium OttesenSCG-928-A16]|nr:hypothetical protein [Ruminococcaceae bacterium OttesenSCG-928-A16]